MVTVTKDNIQNLLGQVAGNPSLAVDIASFYFDQQPDQHFRGSEVIFNCLFENPVVNFHTVSTFIYGLPKAEQKEMFDYFSVKCDMRSKIIVGFLYMFGLGVEQNYVAMMDCFDEASGTQEPSELFVARCYDASRKSESQSEEIQVEVQIQNESSVQKSDLFPTALVMKGMFFEQVEAPIYDQVDCLKKAVRYYEDAREQGCRFPTGYIENLKQRMPRDPVVNVVPSVVNASPTKRVKQSMQASIDNFVEGVIREKEQMIAEQDQKIQALLGSIDHLQRRNQHLVNAHEEIDAENENLREQLGKEADRNVRLATELDASQKFIAKLQEQLNEEKGLSDNSILSSSAEGQVYGERDKLVGSPILFSQKSQNQSPNGSPVKRKTPPISPSKWKKEQE